MLKIALLGPLSAEIDGAPVRFETRKIAALLAYLILNPENKRRERLAALFWPDYDSTHAMANLRRALGSLIHSLPPGYVLADHETICWRELEPIHLDVREFQAGVRAVRSHLKEEGAPCSNCLETLARLADLYRADFLDGLTLPDCPDFDEWQYIQREELRQAFAWTLERLAVGWSARSAWEHAAEAAQRWVRLDRLDAAAQLTLSEIYAKSGQPNLAQRQYEAYTRAIQAELDQEPEEGVQEQFRAILSLTSPAMGEEKQIAPVKSVPAAASQGFQTLLKTKLYIPRVKPGRVRRPRLLSRLEDVPKYKLTLISAPAGFGKSCLLAEWAVSTTHPVGWVSLDRDDNDPRRFLGYVCAALDSLIENITADARGLLELGQTVNPKAVISILLNAIETRAESVVLMLDDYQFVTAEAVHEAVTYLLEHATPNLHLVIATRADPVLPLARLRAAGELLEIRTDDLRFTLGESDALFRQVSGLDLAAADIEAIAMRAEGWAVGLQMAALSLQGVPDRAQFVRNFSGTHRFILDYLIQEVLDRQTPQVRDFLLKTSILERLSGELCEAVTGEAPGSGFHTLGYLERSNLFLVPLDEDAASGAGAGWFRYHHLFADLLTSQLQKVQPQIVPELHHRASAWYEKKGWLDQAIEHSFSAHDFERAAQLVEKGAQKLIYQFSFGTTQGWIDRLPESMALQRTWIGITQGWIWIAMGRLSGLGSWMDKVEQNFLALEDERYSETERQDIRVNIASVRAYDAFYKGDLQRCAELAGQALQGLSPANADLRVRIQVQLGETYLMLQNLEQAGQYLYQAIEAGILVGDFQSVTTASMRLYKTLKILGKLNEAEAMVLRVLQALADAGRENSPVAAKPEMCWGDLLRERGQMAEAGAQLARALEHARQYNTPMDIVTAHYYKSMWLISLSKWDEAQKLLEEARPFIQSFTMPPAISNTWALCRARVWLAKNEFERVEGWIRESPLFSEKGLSYPREEAGIFQARLLLKQGRADEAQRLLAELIGKADAGQRNGYVIQLLLLLVLAWDALGEETQALETLVRCLRLAHAQGYVTLFLEEGEPIFRLLHVLQSNLLPQHLAAFTHRLMQAYIDSRH